jgi:hypothetical protein
VRHADRDHAAGAGFEAHAAAVEIEHRITVEDVEALFVGVQVQVDPAVLVELGEAEAYVDRPAVAADQFGAAQPDGTVGEHFDRLAVGGGQVMVAG